jgi:hypothetical protein
MFTVTPFSALVLWAGFTLQVPLGVFIPFHSELKALKATATHCKHIFLRKSASDFLSVLLK